MCVFQQGGNDGENTLIRHDAAGYQTYAATRTVASGINIAQAQLLPVQPARGGPAYGFHPACAPLQALFNQKKLAVVANVGMLVQPSTKPGLETQGAPRPANLFSHSDQELAMQSAVHTGFERVGWGGRIADRLDAANPGTLFPPMISTNGLRTYVSGRTSVPLTVPSNPWFTLYSSGEGQYQYDVLRDAALREMLAHNRGNLYDVVAQLYAEEGMAASSVVFPILQNKNSVVTPFFASLDTEVGRQLQDHRAADRGSRADADAPAGVLRAPVGLRHARQPGGHPERPAAGLSPRASKHSRTRWTRWAWRDSVTTFTLSEFGRTFKPASNQGTDHGWGNYAFVVGGAVRGGDFYGTRAHARAERPGRPRQQRPLDSHDVGRAVRRDACAAGSASPRATCRTSSRTSARSRTPTSDSWRDAVGMKKGSGIAAALCFRNHCRRHRHAVYLTRMISTRRASASFAAPCVTSGFAISILSSAMPADFNWSRTANARFFASSWFCSRLPVAS